MSPRTSVVLLLCVTAMAIPSNDAAAAAEPAAAAPSTRPAVELVAHRGESHDAPENTMAAFRLAWERGDDALELDVRLTRDGRLICVHDADTQRTAGVKLIVKDQDADALRALDVGRWKSAAFAGERMPLLDEALAGVPAPTPARPRPRVFVEVKVGPEAVPELVRCVERAGRPAGQVVVIAFDHATAREAKRRLPAHKVYWLARQKQDEQTKEWKPPVEELIAKARSAGVDGLDVDYRGPVDAAYVKQVHDAGLELHVWTVDDPAKARRLIEAGVDSVTTNRAAWMREQLRTPRQP